MTRNIRGLKLENKNVLLRADFDVPLEDGKVADDFRLARMRPTIDYILSQKPQSLTLIGHLGRPEGKFVLDLSLKPVKDYFLSLYGEGRFEIKENLRFDPREETNDPSLGQELAQGVDIFVQECFSTCHRAHASMVQIPNFVKESVIGLNLENEIANLSKLTGDKINRPYIVIIGGAKVETKAALIEEFKKVANKVLVGSKYLGDSLDLDIKLINSYKKYIKKAKTILWNGPVGQYEKEEYAVGTREIAQAIAESKAFKVVGGNNTISALKNYNLLDRMDFVSTGGGAMLEFVLGHRLPGLEALGYYGGK